MKTETIESNVQSLILIAMQKQNLGQLDEAEKIYIQLLQTQLDSQVAKTALGDLYLQRGDILHNQGKSKEAIQVYQQALEIDPNFAEVYNNLGNVYQEQGQLKAAIEYYQQALSIKPDFAEAHNNLGNALKGYDLEAAIQAYRQALSIKPDWADTHYNLGIALYEQGQLEAAIECYQQVLRIKPDYAAARFAMCMGQLPIIYSSVDEIQLRRNQYQHHLQELAHHYQFAPVKEQAEAAKVVGYLQPFYLTYQGLNDRDLQQIYGEMITQLMARRYPQWSQPIELPKLAANEKIRVGFISGFFRSHATWKIPTRGWVENLDRSEFELFGYHTGSKRDQETVRAAKAFDKFTQGPLLFEQWAEVIKHDQLHVLIFPEFGMNPMTIRLGCLRLAPIQITSWGHSDTSGLPTIDYYLSSTLMEPENAQDNYTEQLVRLPNLSIHYTPLEFQPQPISKRDIGIADDEIMFWCCQALYKYLPQYDDIFPRIAQALGRCKFVFFKHLASESEKVTEVFRERLRRTFEDFGLNYQDYCIFLSPTTIRTNAGIEIRTFIAASALADVFLDTIDWSGCNTTAEAIAHDIPIVTWPKDLLRGRHSMAILKMMGIEETIAATKEDYVKIAIRLGQDAEYRQHISKLVAQNKYKLYGDLKPVRALEDFLLMVVNKPRRFGVFVAQTLQLALEHHQANRYDSAIQLYHQVLEKQPNHPEALYSLGMLAQQLGQPQTAIEWLSAASLVQPDSVKTWFSLGNLRLGQQQYSEAVIAYRQALALRPDSLPIYNNLGYALQQLGLFDDAINCYQKALELKPDFIEAEANLGNALYAQGKLSSENTRHYAQLNHKLGVAREKAGDLKTAAAYYRQWLKLINPHYAQAVEANPDAETSQESSVTPPITQTEVTVGAYQFPAIPPVSDGEKARPFWSVVVTVYNRTDYLLECLASVLAQWPGFEEMEILVMDDASTTPLRELVNSIGQGVVRYYKNPQNLGLPGNWNAGVALSCGHWIHLLHDDDCILTGFYSRLQQSLLGCSDSVGAAFTGYENINDKGQVIFSQQLYEDYKGRVPQDWLQKIGVANPLSMPAVVIRRETYERLGVYHPDLTYTSDWELYKRIAVVYDWWYEPGILARYREHSNNATTELLLSGTQMISIRRAIEISESYLPSELVAKITAKSRSLYVDYCLEYAKIPLQAGNVGGAWLMLEEALRIDRSSTAVAKLFTWLTQDEALLLRDEISLRLISLPIS